jgi:fatty acid-binding protein DegV
MKTAVEWLVEQIKNNVHNTIEEFELIVEQAKEMEKEQIMEAFEAAEKYCGKDFLHGDLYYNETFKSE